MFLAVQLPGYAQPQAIPGRCWGEEPSCTQRMGLAASAPCTPLSYSLDPRRLSPGVTLPPGTLTMSRNVCSCHNWGAPGIEWVVARDAAQPPAPHSAQVSPTERSWARMLSVLLGQTLCLLFGGRKGV